MPTRIPWDLPATIFENARLEGQTVDEALGSLDDLLKLYLDKKSITPGQAKTLKDGVMTVLTTAGKQGYDEDIRRLAVAFARLDQAPNPSTLVKSKTLFEVDPETLARTIRRTPVTPEAAVLLGEAEGPKRGVTRVVAKPLPVEPRTDGSTQAGQAP